MAALRRRRHSLVTLYEIIVTQQSSHTTVVPAIDVDGHRLGRFVLRDLREASYWFLWRFGDCALCRSVIRCQCRVLQVHLQK